MAVVFRDGYSAYYQEGTRLGGPLILLGYYFVVGLVFLAVALPPARSKRALLILVAVGLLRLLLGDRGEGSIYLLTALMISRYRGYRAPSGRRDTTRVVGIGIALSLVTPIVGSLRQTYGGGDDLNLGDTVLASNPVAATLNTVGTTLYPLVKVIEATSRDVDPLLGGSYLSGVARLLPGWLVPEWMSDPIYASPGVWLQEELGLSYGPGFTPFAEAYLNFGYFGGGVALLCLGVLVTRALSLTNADSTARAAFAFGSFVLAGFAVRGSFNFVIPQVLRFVCLPLLGAALMAARSRRRERENPIALLDETGMR